MTAILEAPLVEIAPFPRTRDEQSEEANELVVRRIGSDPWKLINRIDAELGRLPQQPLPLNHLFTPGLYTREIFMPKGTLLTSRVHLFEHPFVVSAGVVSVWTDDTGWVTLRAPYTGITKPGTRRVLFIHEDCIWSTFHLNPTEEREPDRIVEMVTFDHHRLAEREVS